MRREPSTQKQLCDFLAAEIGAGRPGFAVHVPDEVIRDAFLELYRKRHPGVPEPRVVIRPTDNKT